MQQIEQLALIHTAISFTLLPSRPIRNLPTIRQIKEYRVGLYLLFWQLKTRYHKRKLELQQILIDRKLMFKEEMYSMTREIVLRAYRDKIQLY